MFHVTTPALKFAPSCHCRRELFPEWFLQLRRKREKICFNFSTSHSLTAFQHAICYPYFACHEMCPNDEIRIVQSYRFRVLDVEQFFDPAWSECKFGNECENITEQFYFVKCGKISVQSSLLLWIIVYCRVENQLLVWDCGPYSYFWSRGVMNVFLIFCNFLMCDIFGEFNLDVFKVSLHKILGINV